MAKENRKTLWCMALSALLVSLPLTALGAHPAIEGAEALLKAGKTEEMFLKYGAVSPEGLSPEESASLAGILRQGAAKAEGDDFIAHGLLSRSLALKEAPETLTEIATVEVRLGQRGGALDHLRRALAIAPNGPKAGDASLFLGILLFEDKDMDGAASAFEAAQKLKVPGAKGWLQRARQAKAESDAEAAKFQKTETELKKKLDKARRAAVRDWLDMAAAEAAKEDLAPGGVRKNQSEHFAYNYTATHKTMAEIHQFDKRIQRILEHAYTHVSKTLSFQLDRKVPVMLLTEEEYSARYTTGGVSRAGGFWNGKEIVLNGQTNVDERFVAVMVHELTHAFVHSIIGNVNGYRAMIPKWANEGLAEYVESCATGQGCGLDTQEQFLVAGFLKAKDRPTTLEGLSPHFEEMGPNVRVIYAVAKAAVTHLVEKKGIAAYVATLTEMKKLRYPNQFPKAMKQHLGMTDKELEKELGI